MQKCNCLPFLLGAGNADDNVEMINHKEDAVEVEENKAFQVRNFSSEFGQKFFSSFQGLLRNNHLPNRIMKVENVWKSL